MFLFWWNNLASHTPIRGLGCGLRDYWWKWWHRGSMSFPTWFFFVLFVALSFCMKFAMLCFKFQYLTSNVITRPVVLHVCMQQQSFCLFDMHTWDTPTLVSQMFKDDFHQVTVVDIALHSNNIQPCPVINVHIPYAVIILRVIHVLSKLLCSCIITIIA